MTLDTRAKELAGIVVDYSVSIQPNDILLVQAEFSFKEFAEYIGKLAEDKGANIISDYRDLNEKRLMIQRNDKEELEEESKRKCDLAEKATARVLVDAMTDPHYLKGVDPKKIGVFQSLVSKPFLDRICGNGKEFKGIKWNLVAYPGEGDAKNAGMSLEEYTNFLYGATNIDWAKTGDELRKIKDIFDNAKDVHISVPGQTDFHLSLEGRGGGICDGKFNMPDGETYYGPVEDSANGIIYFPYKSLRDGNELKGIKLEYKDGEVVSFSAEENQPFLETMLDLPGVKRIGELGIANNYGIKRYIQNLLFDEKIGGTIHIALGESYFEPLNEGGGKNKGEIHWDLVCDLRKINNLPGGEIYVNDKLVQKNGVWRFE
jgi:aminopeptidase